MDNLARKFFMKGDYQELCSWFMKRKIDILPPSFLSDTGVIVPGIAAGFLYLTNSAVGIIDVFISNPDSVKIERDQALDAVLRRLLWMARDFDCKVVKGNTRVPAVLARVKKFGFNPTGEFTCVVKGV